MWDKPLFRYGVICAVSGALLFRLSFAIGRYLAGVDSAHPPMPAPAPPTLLLLFVIGSLLLTVGGVIAIVISLLTGDKASREKPNLR